MRKHKLTMEQRYDIVKRLNSEGVNAVSAATKIPTGTLHGWRSKFKAGFYPIPGAKPNGSSDAHRDAIIYLRHSRDAAVKALRDGKVKSLSRDTLYAMLALDALEGR